MVYEKGQDVPLGLQIINLYVYSSIHIGICALSYSLFGQLISHNHISLDYALCVCFATVALYCIHRLVGIGKMESFAGQGRFGLILKYKRHIQLYFIVASIAAFWFFMQMQLSQQFILIGAGILTLSYAVPFFKGKRIRDFNYIKIILIAISWTFLCIVMPLESIYVPLKSFFLIGIASVFYFIGLTVPFDIRDIQIDNFQKVKTLATALGTTKSINLSMLCIIASLIFIGSSTLISKDYSLLATWIILSICTLILIRKSTTVKSDLYFSLFMDGMIGLFYPVYLMAEHFILR